MAIKYKAKDTDDLEKELEEWSMNMNLFQTVATNNEKEKVVKVESDELADDHSKRSGLKHFIDIKIQFIALYRLFFCQTFCFLMW